MAATPSIVGQLTLPHEGLELAAESGLTLTIPGHCRARHRAGAVWVSDNARGRLLRVDPQP